MNPTLPRPRTDAELLDANRRFYDALWTGARLVEPQRFNTWPLVSSLVAASPRRLEVAPGLRPRLPIEATHCVDISAPALRKLRERGARVVLGSVTALPFPDAAFDLVCALDVVEHVDDDDRALAELSRVAAAGATFLLSAPLHASRWTEFDAFVGHRRRYEPPLLVAQLARHGFRVDRSAEYGVQPRSSRLLGLGMWCLTHHHQAAMWLYNRVMTPLAVRLERKLALTAGLIDTDEVDEVLLMCRK
jgi:SAM-dependent methyltransferase